jgi:hypothetical protein
MPFTYPIWRNAERVIAVSEFTANWRSSITSEVEVIPNGVDLTLYGRRQFRNCRGSPSPDV